MANKLMSMGLVIALVAAAASMLHGSSAQTTHVVGDTTGWTIPTNGGASIYSTWASRNTFTVGDILVFRFSTGAHDVTQVSRAGFDGCNATNPISQNTNGPANISLTTAGQHYYICSISGHCGIGQKLAINVSAAPASAPQPSAAASPPRATPAATPAPSPSPSDGTASPPSSGPAPTTPPSSTDTPPSVPSADSPPPSTAAPSIAIATLPLTFLSVALAFLY
nr:blue copper protein-like [Ipomoea batatas]